MQSAGGHGSFELPLHKRYAATYVQPHAGVTKTTGEARAIPIRRSQRDVTVAAFRISVVPPVLDRRRIEIERTAREEAEICHGARGITIVEILQYVVTDDQVEALARSIVRERRVHPA